MNAKSCGEVFSDKYRLKENTEPMFPAQKSSTQQFTEIEDIVDEIVLLKSGNACIIIEVTASNFALLSRRDQDTKIYSYAAFLNSLTFPIQILVRNKRVDITNYLKILDEQEAKTTNSFLAKQIRYYKQFIQEMVKINVVLNKAFYIIIAYSPLEGGVSGNIPGSKGVSPKETHVINAKRALHAKADSIQSQVRRFAMSTRLLEKKELVKLFFDIFNEGTEGEFDMSHIDENISAAFVKSNTIG
jgi:hypothetical protein